MALTPAEQKAIEAGAEAVRRKQETEEERQKTKEFQEMKRRNESRPPEKPMPTSREFIKQKAVAAGERVGRGMVNFLTASNTPKTKRQSASRRQPRYSAAPPRPRRRRSAPRHPPAQQGFFGSGNMGMPEFRGDLLGGFGSFGGETKRRKKGGWGLL